MDGSVFLNGNIRLLFGLQVAQSMRMGLDNATRAAIHAPTSKDWQESIDYPFGM